VPAPIQDTAAAVDGERNTITDISVTPVNDSDRAGWLPLWKGYQAFYGIDVADSSTELLWTRLLDRLEPITGLIARVDNEAVGLAHCIRHRSTWTAQDYLYLQDLFVTPLRRGRGIARALLRSIQEIATNEHCARVYWLTHESNLTARILYDRVAIRTGFIHYAIPTRTE
jgi:GNAT superfamily N-acetyltransferase